MRSGRGLRPEASRREIASGPGKLTQAMGLTLDDYGRSLLAGRISLRPRHARDPALEVATSRRIGLSKGRELPYRFYAVGNPHVTRARP